MTVVQTWSKHDSISILSSDKQLLMTLTNVA